MLIDRYRNIFYDDGNYSHNVKGGLPVMSVFLSVIQHVWSWLVHFAGSVAMVFLIIAAVLILAESIWYRMGRKSSRKGGDPS